MPKPLFNPYGIPIDPALHALMTKIRKLTYDYVDSLDQESVDLMELYALNKVLQNEVDTVVHMRLIAISTERFHNDTHSN